MNMTVISRAIQVVTMLFGAFYGFTSDIAPPEAEPSGSGSVPFALGLGNFMTFGLLLLASGLSKNLPRKKFKWIWLTAAAALLATSMILGFRYRGSLMELTFRYPEPYSESIFLKGYELTEKGKILQANGLVDREALLAVGPGNIDKVWTPPSIRRAEKTLTYGYVAFLVSLFGSIFCLTEGILLQGSKKKSRRQDRPDI